MAEINTLKTGIKSRIVATLGSAYSELSYNLDIAKNNFKGNTNRYGVLAGPLTENESRGVIGKYTVDQLFVITFTDSWGNKPTNDDAEVSTLDAMMENTLTLYKDLVNTQAGSPSLVTLVSDFSVEAPEIIDGNIATIVMSITITYRKTL